MTLLAAESRPCIRSRNHGARQAGSTCIELGDCDLNARNYGRRGTREWLAHESLQVMTQRRRGKAWYPASACSDRLNIKSVLALMSKSNRPKGFWTKLILVCAWLHNGANIHSRLIKLNEGLRACQKFAIGLIVSTVCSHSGAGMLTL